jgi:phytoene dehydrogenase-like protein
LDVTIPTILDSSLAPEGKHVLSAYVQFAPYKLKDGNWDARRAELGETVLKTLAQYAPNLPSVVEGMQVIMPADLEKTYGFTGGHIFHGELALDQLFTMRPVLDWARYKTPVRGLFMCSSGTHPGNGLTGASGANAAREIIHELR